MSSTGIGDTVVPAASITDAYERLYGVGMREEFVNLVYAATAEGREFSDALLLELFGEPDGDGDDEPQGVVPTFADGAAIKFVAAYSVDRAYGGPEEGGWYFDTGSLKAVRVCRAEEVEAMVEELRVEFPRTGRRNSVLSGPDFDVTVHDTYPVEEYPVVRPHYE